MSSIFGSSQADENVNGGYGSYFEVVKSVLDPKVALTIGTTLAGSAMSIDGGWTRTIATRIYDAFYLGTTATVAGSIIDEGISDGVTAEKVTIVAGLTAIRGLITFLNMRKQIKDLKQTQQRTVDQSALVNSQQLRIQTLEGNVGTLLQDQQAKAQLIGQNNTEISDLQQKVESLETRIRIFENVNNKMVPENDLIQLKQACARQIGEITAKIETLKKENDELIKKSKTDGATISAQLEQILKFEEIKCNLVEQTKKNFQDSLNALQQGLLKANTEIGLLKKEKQELNTEPLDKLRKENTKLKNDLSILKADLESKLQESERTIRKNTAEIEKLQNTQLANRRQIAELQSENSQLRQENEELSQLKESVDGYLAQIQTQHAEIASLKGEIEDLKARSQSSQSSQQSQQTTEPTSVWMDFTLVDVDTLTAKLKEIVERNKNSKELKKRLVEEFKEARALHEEAITVQNQLPKPPPPPPPPPSASVKQPSTVTSNGTQNTEQKTRLELRRKAAKEMVDKYAKNGEFTDYIQVQNAEKEIKARMDNSKKDLEKVKAAIEAKNSIVGFDGSSSIVIGATEQELLDPASFLEKLNERILVYPEALRLLDSANKEIFRKIEEDKNQVIAAFLTQKNRQPPKEESESDNDIQNESDWD